MKIMYIIDASPINGGAPISTMIIAKEMAKKHNVYVVMPDCDYIHAENTNLHVVKISKFKDYFPFVIKNPIKSLVLVKELKSVIWEIKPDIIHANMPRGGRTVGVLKLTRSLPDKPLLIYTDREHVAYLRAIYKPLYKIFIAKQYDKVICLSHKSKSYWMSQDSRLDVRTIPNTGGKVYETYSQEDYSLSRNKFKLDNNIVILFAGRVVEDKNWPLAIQIINKIKDLNVNIIVAMSYFNNQSREEFLRFKNDVLRFNNVKVIENANVDMMNQLYYTCDIFVLTSKRESFGRTAIEAMSRKCAVIGTDVGGLPETIGKRECILDSKAENFYMKIKEYIDDIDKINEDKEFFYLRYRSLYTLKKQVELHEYIYGLRS